MTEDLGESFRFTEAKNAGGVTPLVESWPAPRASRPGVPGNPAELGAQLTDDIENTVAGHRPADLPEPQIDQGKPERGPDVDS